MQIETTLKFTQSIQNRMIIRIIYKPTFFYNNSIKVLSFKAFEITQKIRSTKKWI